MTTLRDRYVWAVLRAVPEAQRRELEPEIRALVADTMDAHAGLGSPDAVELAALEELGDPEILASRYADRTHVLIGPRFYPAWRKLVTTLLPILVPLVAIVVGAAGAVSGQPMGQVITSALGAALGVALQTLFWVTLVFAIIERTADRTTAPPARRWTPADLPAGPARERMGIADVVATVIANLFVIGAIIWVQTMSPILIEGTRYPLFDPVLWSFWLPYFIAVPALEILFAIGLSLRGRWTWGLAGANAALGAAFAIPALWLLQQGLLFNPALVDRIAEETAQLGDGAWFLPTALIIGVVIAAAVAWDAIDGFRKAYRSTQSAEPVAAGPGAGRAPAG